MSVSTDQELNRYSITVGDFEKAIEFLQEADNHPSHSLAHESLLISAIIYYCRPFTFNERERNAEAIPKIEFESFSNIFEEENTLHEKCMIVRNKAVAHAEWTNYPTRRDNDTNVISSRRYSLLSEKINWQSLLALAKKLSDQCHNSRADYLREKRL